MNNVVMLDSANVCVSIKQVKDDYVLQDKEMLVTSYNETVCGKTYDASTNSFSYTQSQIEQQAKEWRDSELKATDSLALLPDYPNTQALLAYRQALRDWPSTPEFPNTKPEM